MIFFQKKSISSSEGLTFLGVGGSFTPSRRSAEAFLMKARSWSVGIFSPDWIRALSSVASSLRGSEKPFCCCGFEVAEGLFIGGFFLNGDLGAEAEGDSGFEEGEGFFRGFEGFDGNGFVVEKPREEFHRHTGEGVRIAQGGFGEEFVSLDAEKEEGGHYSTAFVRLREACKSCSMPSLMPMISRQLPSVTAFSVAFSARKASSKRALEVSCQMLKNFLSATCRRTARGLSVSGRGGKTRLGILKL